MDKKTFKPPRVRNDMTGYLRKLIKDRRVAILIDAANLYHAAQVAKMRLDFIQISTWFHQCTDVTALHFYTAYNPEDEKQKEFFLQLEEAKYTVVKKPIRKFENLTKGNMDIELTVDAMMRKDEYDFLILLSGDGDFHYLVKALENSDKKTIILGIGGFTSYELHQEADSYFFLNRISQVWKSPRKKKTPDTEQYVLSTDDFQKAYSSTLARGDYAINAEVALPGKQVREKNSAEEIEKSKPEVMRIAEQQAADPKPEQKKSVSKSPNTPAQHPRKRTAKVRAKVKYRTKTPVRNLQKNSEI